MALRISQIISNATAAGLLPALPKIEQPELQRGVLQARKQKPLSKLQWILLSLILDDCRIQEFSNRSVPELANMSGYTVDGVKKALRVLNAAQMIFTKKGSTGVTSVRVVTRLGFVKAAEHFKGKKKKAHQKAPQEPPIPYRVSNSSLHDNEDLLAKDSIIKMTNKEEEVFKALELNLLDETIILSRIKRSHLSPEARFRLANKVVAAHYKKRIESPRAYYLKAIENYVE